MDIRFRPARAEDFEFARSVYFETMRWIIERLVGWDQASQEEKFATVFNFDEAEIITLGSRDVGWIQKRSDEASMFLASLYIVPAFQRQGIGTYVVQCLLSRAKHEEKSVTLGVVKINPAVHFYERHGFKITHADEFKFYMRADPTLE